MTWEKELEREKEKEKEEKKERVTFQEPAQSSLSSALSNPSNQNRHRNSRSRTIQYPNQSPVSRDGAGRDWREKERREAERDPLADADILLPGSLEKPTDFPKFYENENGVFLSRSLSLSLSLSPFFVMIHSFWCGSCHRQRERGIEVWEGGGGEEWRERHCELAAHDHPWTIRQLAAKWRPKSKQEL